MEFAVVSGKSCKKRGIAPRCRRGVFSYIVETQWSDWISGLRFGWGSGAAHWR